LLVIGEGRSGKSYAACAVANLLYERATEGLKFPKRDAVRFYSVQQLASDLRQAAADGWLDDLRREINSVEVLLLDDLATPDFSPFLLSQLYLITEYRIHNNKGIIITVDADPANIIDGAQWVRIYNRLREIILDGRDMKDCREVVTFPKINIKDWLRNQK